MIRLDSTSLVVDVKPGEVIDLQGVATVELVHKSGQIARLRVTASPDIRIKRQRAEGQKQG